MTEITFDEFKKADIRIGTILSAEKVHDADKLIKLMINLGEENPRQILSGIAIHYEDPSVLVGKQVPVLANLPTRTIRGLESHGMVLYAVGGDFLTTVEPEREIPNGTSVQ
ncbi:MAG TPA: tRNA-binding protein [Candidatus Yonathbacteria bacterium]|nr:tRNA-binding protein [Candidatus Yonathbacteria bacterium]